MLRLRALARLRCAVQAAEAGSGPGPSAAAAAVRALQAATVVTLARWGSWRQAAAVTQPWPTQRRHASDDPHSSGAAGAMPEVYYHKLVDHTLDDLLERLETFVEDLDIVDGDVEYSQGVLTVRLGDLGTYVINKQTPNRQIWMSSPLSGPVRYDWGPGKWVYQRDGHDMHSRLSAELMQLTGHELDLSPCFACGKLNTCQGEQCDKGA